MLVASQLAGPALIEDRNGTVRVILNAARFGQESTLKASLNILARNGDIEVVFPKAIKADLDVEVHHGTVVNAPSGLKVIEPDDDRLITTSIRPVLGLRDNELRAFHRSLNGGGPDIKLIALNGNVTLHEMTDSVAITRFPRGRRRRPWRV
jgi:hypothetical protein